MCETVIDKDSPFYGHVAHVIVMGCTRYARRQECIKHELACVGISDYVSLIQADSQVPEYVLRSVPHAAGVDSHVTANIWFNHYNAIRLCYDLGYDSVLLVEDDAAFSTDHKLISAALGEVKCDYSMLLLDSMVMSPNEHASAVKRGVDSGLSHWGVVSRDVNLDSCPRCAGCRILSKDAISAYLLLHECVFTGACPDGVVYPADMWHAAVMHITGKPILYAVPQLSVQGLSAELGRYTGRAHANYVSCGVDVSKYGHTADRPYGSSAVDSSKHAQDDVPQSAPVSERLTGIDSGDICTSDDMWSRFDFKVVSHNSGHMDRKEVLDKEFARVGLCGVMEFWDAPDPFIGALERSVRMDRFCSSDRHLVGCTLKHQQMIRAAYDTGASFGLFMESDIVFLRDKELIRESISRIPDDADVLLFEWIAPWGPDTFYEHIKQRESGDFWYKFGRTGVLNTGCYALSRKGMSTMLRVLEAPADGKTLFEVVDRHWSVLSDESDLNMYVSSPVVCVQDESKHRAAYDAVGAARASYGS